MDAKHYTQAIQWYRLYTKLKNTWVEELFEAHMRITRCMIQLQFDDNKIIEEMNNAIAIFSDRAEPYYILGKYFNDNSNTILGYKYLKLAQKQELTNVINKYTLFINPKNYNKYINDELAVSCYWTKKYEEGLTLINDIIDDAEFLLHKERLEKNKQFMMNMMNKEKDNENEKDNCVNVIMNEI